MVNQDGSKYIRYVNVPNKEIWKLLGIAPMDVELKIARLKMFQSFLIKPDFHAQYFTAMFGHFKFERIRLQHKRQGNTHEYMTQLIDDLQCLDELDDAAWILDAMGDYPLKLVLDPELRSEFLRVDFVFFYERGGYQIVFLHQAMHHRQMVKIMMEFPLVSLNVRLKMSMVNNVQDVLTPLRHLQDM